MKKFREIDSFEFTSFFLAWTFFNFLAHYVLIKAILLIKGFQVISICKAQTSADARNYFSFILQHSFPPPEKKRPLNVNLSRCIFTFSYNIFPNTSSHPSIFSLCTMKNENSTKNVCTRNWNIKMSNTNPTTEKQNKLGG